MVAVSPCSGQDAVRSEELGGADLVDVLVGAQPGLGDAGDVLGNVIAPAILSEGAGQLAEGTDYEGVARMAGAVTGNVGIAGARAYNAPEMVLRRATGDVTPNQWDEAFRMQDTNTTGVALTGPEIISQVQGGGSALPNLQRAIEGSLEGRARTAPFFAERPAQVDDAVFNVLDLIAPQSQAPSTLGPRAAQAAADVIDTTRRDVNAQTRPSYQAAEPQRLPQQEYDQVASDPSYQVALARLRNNPELGPRYQNMPDESVAVIDAVTKDMAARGEALRNAANPLYGPELAALNTSGAMNARTAARTAVLNDAGTLVGLADGRSVGNGRFVVESYEELE